MPTYLHTTGGGGWPKAMRHENACLLNGKYLDYHCHCPSKTLINFRKQARQRHTHYRSYTHYSGTSLRRVSERCAQALTQAYHSYTHTLLGVVHKEVSAPVAHL